MTEAPVANHVDDHILIEGHPIFHCQAGDEQYRFGIIAVDVKNRGLHHLGHVGAIERRTGVKRVAGGETDLVVDDDMDGAAGAIAAHLRKLQGFHVNALAGKGGIAMDQ